LLTGATILDIGIGLQLDGITHVLGDFSSVTATTTTAFPVITVVDASGKPTGDTVNATAPDHVAFSGKLKSGAFASVTWRTVYSYTNCRKQFLWIIDGDEGSIALENDAGMSEWVDHSWDTLLTHEFSVGGTFFHLYDPKVYLNGESVEIDGHGGVLENLSVGWAEFAKGENGEYATLEDAVRIRRLCEAISTSAKEGRTVDL
jgi:predicted dehydrogenase